MTLGKTGFAIAVSMLLFSSVSRTDDCSGEYYEFMHRVCTCVQSAGFDDCSTLRELVVYAFKCVGMECDDQEKKCLGYLRVEREVIKTRACANPFDCDTNADCAGSGPWDVTTDMVWSACQCQ